jgi:hypothetical protein
VAVRALALALSALACGALPATADTPMPPNEVRAERRIREERPLWREALALPDDVLLLAAWPLKQALFWAEAHHLDDRIGDFFSAPFRRRSGGDR